ncbi:MAG: hypothetical protein ABEJ91_03255 [Candidatus Nanohaloarchaea archaeon]
MEIFADVKQYLSDTMPSFEYESPNYDSFDLAGFKILFNSEESLEDMDEELESGKFKVSVTYPSQ